VAESFWEHTGDGAMATKLAIVPDNLWADIRFISLALPVGVWLGTGMVCSRRLVRTEIKARSSMSARLQQELLEHLGRFERSQEHLLRHWGQLTEPQRERLARQVLELQPPLLMQLFRGEDDAPDWTQLANLAEPPSAVRLAGTSATARQEARQRGEQLLRDGRLGMVLVAGGQGTRLGFPYPKGMFPIGPVSGRSLFQVLIEHLRAVSRRYDTRVPLYVMTSFATHQETVAFLEKHDRFGLAADDLIVFCQGTMPALDAATGDLLLAEPDSLALSPDGHGGMLPAFVGAGGLRHAQDRGIQQLFYGQIDNPLLQVCDPELIGFHDLANSEMTTQVVRKREPMERVGNVVSIGGSVRIIEYSDLPEAAARRTDEAGELLLWAGNIAVHVFSRAFLERAAADPQSLPFHRARKKVPHLDAQGRPVDPTQPNGLKFERFIFDLLPQARNALVVEADASSAFAPVKNADSEPCDSPRTAKEAMLRLHARWLVEADIDVPPDLAVEISPFLALNAAELRQRLRIGGNLNGPTYLEP